MAETGTDPLTPPSGDGKGKGKKGFGGFLKKNKTLVIVGAAGGLFFLLKKKKGGEEGEGVQVENTQGEVQGSAISAYEQGRVAGEVRPELLPEPAEPREPAEPAERPEPREPNEPTPSPEPTGPDEPAPSPSAPAGGISIHGRTFQGATASRIAKSGKTQGGKAYVEYVITFPGSNQHWQYFTATGNWRQVADSSGGAAANKPTKGSPPKSNPTTRPGQTTTHGGVAPHGDPTVHAKPPTVKVKVGQAQPVSAPAQNAQGGVPQQNVQHPAAVNTGNPCVKGGVGGHTAPAGYHLFCQGGYIWRAPN